MLKKSLLNLGFVALACQMAASSYASILPGTPQQKWEVNLDGFGKIYYDDGGTLADPTDDIFRLRSLTKTSSLFKGQGEVTTPSDFIIGLDPGGVNVAPSQGFIGVVGTLITGLRVIAVDEFTGPGAYTRASTPASIAAALAGAGTSDIIYFGAEVGVTPKALFYHESSILNADLTPSDSWNTTGDSFDGIFGAGFSDLLLETVFQDLGGTDATGVSFVAAPAGTLLTQVLSSGSVRPFAMLDVIGGLEAGLIQDGGLTFDLTADSADAGDSTFSDLTKSFVGDIAISLASTVPNVDGFSTLSDPAEFVSAPEPTSAIAWAVLTACVSFFGLRRKR
jgi:hypothetical protein